MSSSSGDFLDGLRGDFRDHERERRSRFADRYEILGELGRGGMGAVYRARDLQLDRPVALKVLMESGAPEEARLRFVREARSMARLAHPNVVGLFDAGEFEGQPYLVMELVQGTAFSQVLAEKKTPRRELVAILEQASRGIAEGHRKGIVHRDVKPANLLIAEGGAVKVTDFGLAHLLGGRTAITQEGWTIGTPAYMAPEQARGRTDQIGPRTDVYALGVVLYEILAGRTPHCAPRPIDILAKILNEEPAPPGSGERDLEAICRHAMSKEAADRYAHAGEFADELRRWLAGEPVQATGLSPFRALRSMVRRRVGVVAAALLVAAAIGGWVVVDSTRRAARVRHLVAGAASKESAGRLDEARDLYLSALAIDDRNAAAAAGLARVRGILQQNEDGRRLALSLVEEARPLLNAAAKFQDADLERRLQEPMKKLQAAIEADPSLPTARYLLGRTWDLLGRDDLAEEAWRAVAATDPRFAPARLSLGRLLLMRLFLVGYGADREDAIPDFMDLERLRNEAAAEFRHARTDPDPLAGLLAQAMEALIAGDAGLLAKLTRRGISEFAGREGVEDFHWLEGMSDPALRSEEPFNRALEISPRHVPALLGRAHSRTGRNDRRAIDDLTSAIEMRPRLLILYGLLGQLYQSLGQIDQAIEVLTRGIRVGADLLDPVNRYLRRRALISRGFLRILKDDYKAAIEDFEQAMDEDSAHGRAYDGRGHARELMGDTRGARADFDRALQISLRLYVTWSRRALLRYRDRDFSGALADLNEAIALAPGEASYRLYRAQVHFDLGDLHQADVDVTESLRLASGDPEAWHWRALLRQRQGRLAEARQDAEQALKTAPQDWPHRPAMEAMLKALENK